MCREGAALSLLLELVKRLIEVVAHPDLPFDASELAFAFLHGRDRSDEPHKRAVVFHNYNVLSVEGAFEKLVKPATGLADVNLWHSSTVHNVEATVIR